LTKVPCDFHGGCGSARNIPKSSIVALANATVN
jgi:hypothetical protein